MITRHWFQFIAGTAALVALAGCDAKVSLDNEPDGTEEAAEADDGDSDVRISLDSDGTDEDGEARSAIKFDIEGFSLDIDVPEIKLDATDVDVDDANLYPGSKVTGIDIRASEKGKHDDARVIVSFESPAAADKVADWFESRFEEEKFDISRDGNRLTGTTDEGDAIDLQITSAGAGKSKGKLHITESS